MEWDKAKAIYTPEALKSAMVLINRELST